MIIISLIFYKSTPIHISEMPTVVYSMLNLNHRYLQDLNACLQCKQLMLVYMQGALAFQEDS